MYLPTMVHLMIEEMLHNHAPNHGVRIARCRLERHIARHIVCGAFRHGADQKNESALGGLIQNTRTGP